MADQFGGARVKRGIAHFLLGKAVSSVAGFAGMVLVVRLLAVQDFATYSVYVGLVEILTALTGLGMAQTVLRYVPELFARQQLAQARELIRVAFGIRFVALLGVVMLAWWMPQHLDEALGVADAGAALQAFLLVVLLRVSGHFLSQVLESTLHQSIAQLAFTVGSITRCAGMALLVGMADASLLHVIWAEAVAEALALLLMIGGLLRVFPRVSGGVGAQWLRENWQRLSSFARSGYLQHLAILPFGGSANRLVGGHYLNASAMASYGFAQTLCEYIKRYLPAQLLAGLIRPVVVARYASNGRFEEAANVCQQVLHINVLMILAVVTPLVIGGAPLLGLVSAGKYGQEALVVLLALLAVLVLETQRQQLDLLVQTVERYDFLILSNGALSASLLVTLVVLPWLGPVAFPLVNGLALVGANAIVVRRLQGLGHRFQHDWRGTAVAVAMAGASIAVGRLLIALGGSAVLGAVIGFGVYVALAMVFSRHEALFFYRSLTQDARLAWPTWPEPGPRMDAPRIAFGVLSCRPGADKAVDEIARLVAPHIVYVHHDPRQGAEFQSTEPNVRVLAEPVATAWGDWSLVAATQKLMRAAFEDPSTTHFQLLSEACLPIKSMADFERYLMRVDADVMIDLCDLKDSHATLSHGWRYYAAAGLERRLMRRLSLMAWGRQPTSVARASLHLQSLPEGVRASIRMRLAGAGVHVMASFGRRRLRRMGLRATAIGSQWFGVNRRAGLWMLACADSRLQFNEHFRRAHIPDEAYFQTLVANAIRQGHPIKVAPCNHALLWAERKSGPDALTDQNVTEVATTDKHFARKFPLETDSPVRRHFTLADGAASIANERKDP